MIRTSLIFLALTFISPFVGAKSLTNDLEELGANKAILKRARALDPKNRVRVVQNRAVDRDLRLELAVHYGTVAGGDPYLQSQNLGGQVEFHINPNWSIGARYYDYSNALSAEGDRVFQDAERRSSTENVTVPELDQPYNATIATISWYPLYGKMNLFDQGISQFDIYAIAGYGKIELEQGPADTYTFGGGLGLWITNHISSRVEVRYQGYTDHVGEGRALDLTIISASIGVLL